MEIFQNFSKHDELNKALSDTLNYANLQSSPRVIKTHLPIGMLPPNILEECKVVYVSRWDVVRRPQNLKKYPTFTVNDFFKFLWPSEY